MATARPRIIVSNYTLFDILLFSFSLFHVPVRLRGGRDVPLLSEGVAIVCFCFSAVKDSRRVSS